MFKERADPNEDHRTRARAFIHLSIVSFRDKPRKRFMGTNGGIFLLLAPLEWEGVMKNIVPSSQPSI